LMPGPFIGAARSELLAHAVELDVAESA
jgi:hypothetical protein